MAVTLFHKKIIRVKNRVVIKNNNTQPPKQEEIPKEENKRIPPQEIQAKIKGKMYARRTINR